MQGETSIPHDTFDLRLSVYAYASPSRTMSACQNIHDPMPEQNRTGIHARLCRERCEAAVGLVAGPAPCNRPWDQQNIDNEK